MTLRETQAQPIGWLMTATASVTAAIFILDLVIPRGIAVPMLYVLPILLTRYIPGWWSTAFLTGGVVLLSWVGQALSSGEITPEVIGNRAMVSFLSLVVAGLLLKEKHLAQQRAKDQAALRESEERYALVVAGSGGAVWDWNVREKRVLFSPSWKALRGLADDEVSDHETEWSSRIHPDDRERVMAGVRDHFEGRTAVFSEEYRVRHKDGRWIWILDHGLAKRDSTGTVVRMAGSETDITARKGAEAALHEGEERLRLLNESLEARVRERTAALAEANERWDWVVRATNDGVWDWDVVHDTAYFSPRWKEMHGFQERDHPESMKAWSARIHPEDRHRVLGALDQYLEGKQSRFCEEYRVERKDGIYFWVLDRGLAVFNDEGRAIRMIGAESDITWRKEAESLLREREAQLRRLGTKLLRAQEEERRRISMDLHDDVMQRMGALTLDLYGLVSSATSPDGELQSQLKACGASAEQLTTDLQRMAHQLHPSILEFGGLEVAAREQVREFAVRTGLSAELQTRNLPKDIPLDHATCLYRVLQEGLQNVQKHADANTVLVRLLGTGQGVGLCIHDDGHGFEEVDGTVRRKGLGLTSMVERVRMLNGTFRIRTKPNEGTELQAWVPLESVKGET